MRKVLQFFMVMISLQGFAFSASANDDEAARLEAANFIEKMVLHSLDRMTESDITEEERINRFREIIHDTFAVQFVGKWVLGRYWRVATEDERAEFMKLFEDRVVLSNAKHFSRFKTSDVYFAVIKSIQRGKNDFLVRTKIGGKKSGQKKVSLDWRLRLKGDRFWVVDIMLEGMSLLQAQRQEFTTLINRNGGKFSALLVELRKLD